MKNHQYFFLLILFSVFGMISCGEESVVPKPRGYMKVVYPEKKYEKTNTDCPFEFDKPVYSQLKDKIVEGESCFKDLIFPSFKAAVHLTYKTVTHDTILAKYMEDSHNLAYDHVEKADNINKTAIFDSTRNVYGIVYEIEGNAASQIQFFLTDSSSHFIRGALYFNHKPNYDSLLPAIQFLREDIFRAVNSFTWKNQSTENPK